jgi:DNA repair protein SbcD/Mre11
MPFPPLRFVHAANVRLASPVWLPGDTPEAIREAAAIATLAAFRNVAQAGLDHDVDFLLLCGDTFVEADRSLAARVALRDGLERLAAAGIPVFVLPGSLDPADAWKSIPDLPELATVFEQHGEPVEVTHDGEVLAIIGPEPGDFGKSLGSDNDPIRIGLRYVEAEWQGDDRPLHCDYLALGGIAAPGTWRAGTGIVHHPGGPQPLSPTATNGSCTLVETDQSRRLQLTSLPTAAIRFEHLKKTLDGSDTPDNLLQTLPGKLALRPAADGELVRCIGWTLDGNGPLCDALQSPASRKRIERELSAPATADVPAIIHQLKLARSNRCDAAPDGLAGDFVRAFTELPDGIAQRLDELASLYPDWKPRLDQLAGRVSGAGILARANHIGRQRLEQPEGHL